MITPIKTRLMLPEYGRNVQEMVKYLKTIENRDKRNEQAKIVVAIMGNIYPYKRDSEEFRNMLWDHLFIIANFDLDIDSPYPMPTHEVIEPKPQKIRYSQTHFVHKQYGVFAQRMIRKVAEAYANQEEKDDAILAIAKYIRQQAYNFNHEHPSNDVIAADINMECKGDYFFDVELLGSTKVDVQVPAQRSRTSSNKRQAQVQQRNKSRKKN